MTSRDIDLFSAESMFRDPVYEDLGYTFDPERNEYFEIIDHPEYGRVRSYIPPRDIADQIFKGRRYGLVTELDDSPYSKPGDLAFQRRMDLMAESAEKRRAEEAARSAERMSPEERKRREKQAEDAFEKSGMAIKLQKGRGYQAGGAVSDIDIFEETRRMIRDDQTPMMPTVTNEQPMFGMPSQDVRSSQNLGRGARESISVSGTPGIDQVFTQIMTSPDFRSIVRVEDLPPENLQQSKEIFGYLMKRDGIDKAVQYLVDTFGKASMFPIEKSLGPDPRTQRVMGMEKSRMSSDGGDAFARAKARAFAQGSSKSSAKGLSKGADRMSGGIGSLMQ